jgi:anthranilate phosphoribosyltransferase
MIQEALYSLSVGQDMTMEEASALMEQLMSGAATDAQIGALLMALRMKGETVQEIAGFAQTMRRHALQVRANRFPLLDTCGTGGGRVKVFNVSTAAAFVACAAGMAVAKHGNRAASGVCGSADVLEALGVNVTISPEQCAHCIDTLGIGFLFARSHHPAMRHVSAARREVGIRTVFNLLGPLTNPAGAQLQVMGVYDESLCPIIAAALKELGCQRAIVIHSDPGTDELSTYSRNRVCELRDGVITDGHFTPQELGYTGPAPDPSWMAPAPTPAENAQILRQAVGEGPASEIAVARRSVVALNAAAALRAGNLAADWPSAYLMAQEIIQTGSALAVIEKLSALTSTFTGS